MFSPNSGHPNISCSSRNVVSTSRIIFLEDAAGYGLLQLSLRCIQGGASTCCWHCVATWDNNTTSSITSSTSSTSSSNKNSNNINNSIDSINNMGINNNNLDDHHHGDVDDKITNAGDRDSNICHSDSGYYSSTDTLPLPPCIGTGTSHCKSYRI